MSEGLEALKDIKDFISYECVNGYEEDIKIIEKELKALEIIKETWGDSILCDIEKGFILGCPYTKLPDKEKCDLLKEVLL